MANTAASRYYQILEKWETEAYNGGYGSEWLECVGEGVKFYAMECSENRLPPTFKGLVNFIKIRVADDVTDSQSQNMQGKERANNET